MLSSSTLYKLYLISFMDLLAVGLTFPILSPYIRSLNASYLTVGVLGSAYSAFQVLSGPLIGGWSDLRGRRSVFLATVFLSSLCYFMLGLCTTIYSVFIVRLLLGVVKHTQTLVRATLVDFVGNDNADGFGRIESFGALGFVVGPVISGHLAELNNGFMIICTLTSILFLVNTEIASTLSHLRKVNWSVCWLPFTLKFFYVYSTTIFFANQSIYLQEKYNLPRKYVGYSISFISMTGILSSLLLGPITRRFYQHDRNCRQRALHCFALMTLCFLGIYVTTNLHVFLLFLIPFGICSAVLRIVAMEMMFQECGESDRGLLTGASASIMSLGRFAAPLSAGFISDAFSQNAVILFAMIPSGLATLLCQKQYMKSRTL